jgi:hypothetical protein
LIWPNREVFLPEGGKSPVLELLFEIKIKMMNTVQKIDHFTLPVVPQVRQHNPAN